MRTEGERIRRTPVNGCNNHTTIRSDGGEFGENDPDKKKIMVRGYF